MVQAKSWSPPPILEDGFVEFTKQSVRALNSIINMSNADIVLTTSHKGRFSLLEWKSIFEKRGINVNRVTRLSSDSMQMNRMEEITTWYNSDYNSVDDFVILDDDKTLNALPKILKSKLVLTHPTVGLNSTHVGTSLSILNTPLGIS